MKKFIPAFIAILMFATIAFALDPYYDSNGNQTKTPTFNIGTMPNVTVGTSSVEIYDTFETQVVLLASNVSTTITPSMPAANQRGFAIGNQGAGSITYNINAAATATSFLLPPSAIISLSPAKVTTLSARGYGAVSTVEVQFFGKL